MPENWTWLVRSDRLFDDGIFPYGGPYAGVGGKDALDYFINEKMVMDEVLRGDLWPEDVLKKIAARPSAMVSEQDHAEWVSHGA